MRFPATSVKLFAILLGVVGCGAVWFRWLGGPDKRWTTSEPSIATGVDKHRQGTEPRFSASPPPGRESDLQRLKELAVAICTRSSYESHPGALIDSLQSLAASYPNETIRAILAGLPECRDCHYAAYIVGFALARTSAADRAAWLVGVGGFPDERIRNELLSSCAQGIAAVDPQSAYDLAMKISDEEEFEYVAGEVLGSWVKFHPGAAPAIFAQIDKGDYTDKRTERFASNWAMADLPAFKVWVSGIENQKAKDVMIPMVVSGALMASDYTLAVEWAQTITDHRIRAGALIRIFETGAAADALDRAGLKAGRDFPLELEEADGPD